MSKENSGNLIDTILGELGIGKFHFVYYIFVCLPIVFTTLTGSSYIFTSRDTSYRCRVQECESSPETFDQPWLSAALPFENGRPVKCAQYHINAGNNGICDVLKFDNSTVEPCTDWVYGEGDTIVKGFDIPCEDWKRSLVGTLNCAGQLTSLLFSGILSDKYGRRNVMILMTASAGVIGLVQSFSANYWSFVVLEFFNLAASSGAYMTAYVLGVEMLTPDKRVMGCALIDLTCTSSAIFLGVIAWMTMSWRALLRATNVPSLFILVTFFTIPESVRWLHAKGRLKTCVEVLKRAAKINGVPLSRTSIDLLEKSQAIEREKETLILSDKQTVDEQNVSIMLIAKSPKLLIRLIICAFCWFSAAFTFYGLVINSVYISDSNESNVYWNYVVVATAELPSILLYLIFLKYVGRKYTLLVNVLGSGSACVIYALIPYGNLTSLILFWLGRLFAAMSFSILYMITSEMFPTSLRNSTMNICSVAGRIGAGLAPQAILLMKFQHNLHMLIYGAVSLLSATIILKLPETKNKSLPNTIKEAESL